MTKAIETETAKRWTMQDATDTVQGEIAAMMQGGFRLVGAAALMYVAGVYWEAPKLQAKDVQEKIHTLMESLNYGKSSKYQLASAALTVARNLTKKWGQPDAAQDLNMAWVMLKTAPTFSEAVDLMVSQIKADYSVDTLKDLYAALAKPGKAKADDKSLSDLFEAAIKKSEADNPAIVQAMMSVVNAHLGPDQIAALLAALTAKISTPVSEEQALKAA